MFFKKKNVTDVCIIGSGAAGGIMAAELARRGIQVVILESGPRHRLEDKFDYAEKYLSGQNPYALKEPRIDLYTNVGEKPYHYAHLRAVGGTTVLWAADAPRLHETDFRMKSLYGLADDWPISYAELEPYYVKAEAELGVSGTDDPFASFRSAGYPLPAFALSYADQIYKRACEKIGITVHSLPKAITSIPYRGRDACCAFGVCKTCPAAAKASTDITHIPTAEKTGNARVISEVTVTRLEVDGTGKVEGAVYAGYDKVEHMVRAQVFVIACGAIESPRLLLLSKSNLFPDGLANSNGLVGKYFMDHPFFFSTATLRQKIYPYRIGFDTAQSNQFYVPEKRDVLPSFRLQFKNKSGPKPGSIAARSLLWGQALKKEVQDSFGRVARIEINIEQLPDAKNWIGLDPEVKDYFGNPVAQINYSMDEYVEAGVVASREVTERIYEALGATGVHHSVVSADAHPMGTCRMGNDPGNSVVDRNLRAHEVQNLFVVSSACFVTGGSANPTLTIAALAVRAAEHIAEEAKRGNL